jgi:hypothetical protein
MKAPHVNHTCQLAQVPQKHLLHTPTGMHRWYAMSRDSPQTSLTLQLCISFTPSNINILPPTMPPQTTTSSCSSSSQPAWTFKARCQHAHTHNHEVDHEGHTPQCILICTAAIAPRASSSACVGTAILLTACMLSPQTLAHPTLLTVTQTLRFESLPRPVHIAPELTAHHHQARCEHAT